jgi:hypothetical protein
MGQQQAQTNNTIIPNKTVVSTSTNEKKNSHTDPTRKSLGFNGWSEEFKHNLEIQVRTEFSNLLCPTTGKERLLSLITPHRRRSSFLKRGRMGNQVVHGIMR